jgi:hypothetical protein
MLDLAGRRHAEALLHALVGLILGGHAAFLQKKKALRQAQGKAPASIEGGGIIPAQGGRNKRVRPRKTWTKPNFLLVHPRQII